MDIELYKKKYDIQGGEKIMDYLGYTRSAITLLMKKYGAPIELAWTNGLRGKARRVLYCANKKDLDKWLVDVKLSRHGRYKVANETVGYDLIGAQEIMNRAGVSVTCIYVYAAKEKLPVYIRKISSGQSSLEKFVALSFEIDQWMQERKDRVRKYGKKNREKEVVEGLGVRARLEEEGMVTVETRCAHQQCAQKIVRSFVKGFQIPSKLYCSVQCRKEERESKQLMLANSR